MFRLPTDYYVRAGDVETSRDFLKTEQAKILDSVALSTRLNRLAGPALVSECGAARAHILAVLTAELGSRGGALAVLRAFAVSGGQAERVEDFPARYFVIVRNVWLMHVRSEEGLVQAAAEMAVRSTQAI